MATPPPVTDTLARFVTDTDYSSISEKPGPTPRMHILDTLGVALAGSQPAAQNRRRLLQETRRVERSIDLGHASESVRSPRRHLPMAYYLTRLTTTTGTRSSMSVIRQACWSARPSPLAENLGASGKELLKAYVLAMEVICKLAAHSPNMQDRGFHSTPVFGSLGAAVACGSLLKLDAARLKAAIGVAASAAGGIHRQQGSMVKPFHAGNSARNGAEAALLASKGFTADAAIFEAPRGFCDTFFGKDTCDYDKMIENLGQPFYLETPGMGLKWHPCSAPQFLAADAALHLKHEHKIDFADVEKIEVRIPPLRYQRHYAAEVKTGLRGKFTINFVVAMGLLDGKLEIATFTDDYVNQPRVQDAFSKVKVIVDESIPEPGPYCPVSVGLKDGTRHSYTATIAKGDPRNPMTEAEVMGKFHGNAGLVLSEKVADDLIATVQRLESLKTARQITQPAAAVLIHV